MEETTRRLSLPAALTIVAVVLVAAVFWAASALAAGGPGSSSSSGEQGSRDSPAVATTVQNEGEAPDDDCPNRGSESESSSDI
jgi:hypothetical protein